MAHAVNPRTLGGRNRQPSLHREFQDSPFSFSIFYLLGVCLLVCLVFVFQRIKPGASYMLRSVTLSKSKIHHFKVHNSGIFQYIYRAVLYCNSGILVFLEKHKYYKNVFLF